MMAARARATAGNLPVIAMGHLHCHGAAESEGAERRILIGGEHALPEDVFPEAFDYVALGHLHRHQTLGGLIRYSGSCFPLSAAEAGYDHGVTILEIEGEVISHTHVPIARPAEMLRFPQRGTMTFAEFEAALDALDLDPDTPSGLKPFVYVNLEATGPAAVLLSEAEKLLAAAPVRPAGIRVRRDAANEDAAPGLQSLGVTNPEALFRPAFVRPTARRRKTATSPRSVKPRWVSDMQILTTCGANLASLADTFEIDLTEEPLRSAGLFAITSKTGAGRTSRSSLSTRR